MKILVAPDKFKGTLTAFEAAEAIAEGIRRVVPQADIDLFPMADGGDGFASVMKHYVKSRSISCKTVNALGTPIAAVYEWMPQSQIAIIETATASGLAKLPAHHLDPLHANTVGTGLLILDALHKGAKTILLGLGGSATTDMGMGILQALGFQFYNGHGEWIKAGGASLCYIQKIEVPNRLPPLHFMIACDVTNPLYGPDGAALVYGPQKGADPAMVAQLEKGLVHANKIFGKYSGKDLSLMPGGGAAGGIAAGIGHFFKVEIQQGFQLVLEASGLPAQLPEAHLLLTGEGRLDNQSFNGKVVGNLIRLCGENRIPVGVLCGQSSLDQPPPGFDNIAFLKTLLPKSDVGEPAQSPAAESLTQAAQQALKLYLSKFQNENP